MYNSIHNYNTCLLINIIIIKFHIWTIKQKKKKKKNFVKHFRASHKLPIFDLSTAFMRTVLLFELGAGASKYG